jgi:O-antigen/teichoic acid export membrane protein
VTAEEKPNKLEEKDEKIKLLKRIQQALKKKEIQRMIILFVSIISIIFGPIVYFLIPEGLFLLIIALIAISIPITSLLSSIFIWHRDKKVILIISFLVSLLSVLANTSLAALRLAEFEKL